MHLSLLDAFARYGAKPSSRLRALSAMAADGAVVLNCASSCFGHPSPGVLRYEDKLSREPADSKETVLLGQHLALARDGALPIRMVAKAVSEQKPDVRSFHVRADLVGRVVSFDGDHFIVDFTREHKENETLSRSRRKDHARR
jgi:hypothetical protein